MANQQGLPVWYELIAPDADAAQAFYGAVVGWRFEKPRSEMALDYRVAHVGDAGVAGVMQKPDGMQMPGSWLVYFAVDDVEASVDAARKAGASVRMPPSDIPGVGRIAFLADPHGTPFYVMRGSSEASSTAFSTDPAGAPGHAVWNELTATDPDAALGFYAGLFGIRKEGAMPMGELGDYSFLHVGKVCIGAMMGMVPNGRPGWHVYFSVDDIDAAIGRLETAGGRSIQGPDQIPGGSYSLVAQDPAGVRFGLVGPRT